MSINLASVAEQKRNGTAGKFGSKATSAPTVTLDAVAPAPPRATSGAYWGGVAHHYGLDEDERVLLDAHLADGTVEQEADEDSPNAGIIADALQPRLVAAIDRQNQVDETIEAKIGARITHTKSLLDDGARISLFSSSSTGGPSGNGYGIHLVHAPGRQKYEVNGATYVEPGDIPARERKGRELAQAFAEQREALDESLDVYDERERAYRRWREFDDYR